MERIITIKTQEELEQLIRTKGYILKKGSKIAATEVPLSVGKTWYVMDKDIFNRIKFAGNFS